MFRDDRHVESIRMRARQLLFSLVLLTPLEVPAQARTDARLHAALGLAGQRDGNRDLGSGGLSADAGVSWPVGSGVRGRFSLTAFSLPIGQGCTCDPGERR